MLRVTLKKKLFTKRVSVSYVTVKPKRFLPKKYVNVKRSFGWCAFNLKKKKETHHHFPCINAIFSQI